MTSLCITLPETPERTERAKAHFLERGIDAHFITGIHALNFGLLTSKVYTFDHPTEGYHIPAKHVGLCLSHYMAWNICAALPDDKFLILEDDALFPEDWKVRLEKVLSDTPPDFDMLYIGSCNCEGYPKTHIKGDIFEVKYPSCTHSIVLARKALPILLETQREVYAPIDLALFFKTLPQLKVYTVLPSICSQYGQTLHP